MKTYRSAIAAITMCLGIMTMNSHAADINKNVPDYAIELDKYVTENFASVVPGAALIVVANGKIQLVKAYGVREVGSRQAVEPDTVFRLASVSKTFASSAIALLVKDGVVSWDTPIQPRLNYIKFKNATYGRQITLKHLLSHTSGLVAHAYTNLLDENVPYNQILKRLQDVDFVCPPGTCYGYQNLVFSLTADIVKSYTGISYEDYVARNIFAPLYMNNASYGLQSFVSAPNHAVPHVKRNNKWVPVEVTQGYYDVAPAAGVNASILDMGQWIFAQLGHMPDVFPETTLAALHTRVVKTSPSQAHYGQKESIGNVHYGLGWRIFDYGNYKNVVHHSGGVKGFRSEIVLNRESQIGMAFLTNAEPKKANEVVFKFLEFYEKYKNTN